MAHMESIAPSGSVEVAEAAAALTAARHPSGGWGWHADHPANTECTALAVMALQPHAADESSAAAAAGVEWLRSRQHADGGWPLSDQVPMSSWTTGLAALALARLDPADRQAVRAGEWLLGQESRGLPWLLRLWQRFAAAERVVDQDPSLIGWPWTEGTSAWVEPTTWALLAVKRLLPHLPRTRAAERIRQAELMLADRMCHGGGWNYGNKLVMGAELSPYPDTTALGLIALHDSPSEAVTGLSLRRLHELTAGRNSTLVLALSALAFQHHGRDAAPLRATLRERVAQDRRGDTRALALALLALNEGSTAFQVTRHA